MSFAVYVHVPFCRRRCAYCAFYSGEPLSQVKEYSGLLCTEIDVRSAVPEGPLTSVYFGGGTPGLLDPRDLATLLRRLDRRFGLAPDCEITLEVNPGDTHDLEGLRNAGIRRLSVGVQGLSDENLSALGRRHTARQAVELIRAARAADFHSVSADLLLGIQGLPSRRLAGWVRRLHTEGVRHLSLYSLEVHPGTPLAARVARGEGLLADEAEEEGQYRAARETAEECGMPPYEVSNFAPPDLRCRHNRTYWEGGAYLGLGPGAHGFLPEEGPWGSRLWNDPSLVGYASALRHRGLPPGGSERLRRGERLLEVLFLALRRPVPLSAASLAEHFELDRVHLQDILHNLTVSGLLTEGPEAGTYTPALSALRRADGVAARIHRLLLPSP